MTRTKLSLLIFFTLILYMFISVNKINNITEDINSLCDGIKLSIEEDDWDKSHEYSEELLSLWDTKSKNMFVYVNIGELDNISTEIVKLTKYTENCRKNEAIPCISVIKYLINEINDLERLTLHNIF